MGHPTDGDQQVPAMSAVPLTAVPESLCAFNDLGRCENPGLAGVHFFKQDSKFSRILESPCAYVDKFRGFRAVLTPDVSILDGMAPWQRSAVVVISRQIGVVWQEHGLTVIPTLRWRDQHDWETVACGVPMNSVVAVSCYASTNDRELRYEFDRGLPYMIERLAPQVVIVYGRTNRRIFRELKPKAEFIERLPPIAHQLDTRQTQAAPNQDLLPLAA